MHVFDNLYALRWRITCEQSLPECAFARAASLKTVWCPKKSCEVMQLVRSMRHPAQLGIMMLVDVSCIMSFQQ